MTAAQWVVIAVMVIEVFTAVALDGQDKGRWSAPNTIIAMGIWALLLNWGGFWK